MITECEPPTHTCVVVIVLMFDVYHVMRVNCQVSDCYSTVSTCVASHDAGAYMSVYTLMEIDKVARYRCLWNKHLSGEECTLKCWLSEHEIMGWRAVSAAGLEGKGLRKRNSLFTDTGMGCRYIMFRSARWSRRRRQGTQPTGGTMQRGVVQKNETCHDWENWFYTQPHPESDFWDCDCAIFETKASIHQPLWVVVVVYRIGFPNDAIPSACYRGYVIV